MPQHFPILFCYKNQEIPRFARNLLNIKQNLFFSLILPYKLIIL
jgi:hypothetical protein